jgi:hypothetical protein
LNIPQHQIAKDLAMTFSTSKFIRAVKMHVFKNKAMNHELDTYWVTEELSIHGRYSPFMLEVQKNQDLNTYFWPLGIAATFVLVTGLILCSCSHWTIQWTGIAVCLLATSMISNIGTALWRCHKTGVLSNKEAA